MGVHWTWQFGGGNFANYIATIGGTLMLQCVYGEHVCAFQCTLTTLIRMHILVRTSLHFLCHVLFTDTTLTCSLWCCYGIALCDVEDQWFKSLYADLACGWIIGIYSILMHTMKLYNVVDCICTINVFIKHSLQNNNYWHEIYTHRHVLFSVWLVHINEHSHSFHIYLYIVCHVCTYAC